MTPEQAAKIVEALEGIQQTLFVISGILGGIFGSFLVKG